MLGGALKLSINSDTLDQNNTDYYFPQGLWCSISGTAVDKCFNSTGLVKNYPSKAYDY